MPMKDPTHPGKVVRVSCPEPLGLTVTEGAKVLGVSVLSPPCTVGRPFRTPTTASCSPNLSRTERSFRRRGLKRFYERDDRGLVRSDSHDRVEVK